MQPVSDFELSQNNTLGLTSRARFGAIAHNRQEVVEAVRYARRNDLELHVLGEGSNVVLSEYIDAFVLLMRIGGCEVSGTFPLGDHVTAGAGVPWHRLVEWTLAENLPGLENLAGIPGTVGAAPVQNIGAYGAELAEFFHSLLALDTATLQICRFDGADCGFNYRDSIFKRGARRFIILEVTLKLPHRWEPRIGYSGLEGLIDATPVQVMQTVLDLRKRKLPDWRRMGNAGSFFHNPVVAHTRASELLIDFPTMPVHPMPNGRAKLSAGWLIEQCGLKGVRRGGASMSVDHGLVMVNHGGASQQDVTCLAEQVRNRVLEKFKVELAQEPVAIGANRVHP
ncbi:UDP-N-acetylmuramate dehydrogenase [Pelagibacterium flavum]|uniref:UDP-N-acetylenolpyruvoylglucosamine reductase n=1 Tax=Pelagibacterium flavum TaxID=2984530 RepID=A0ABY6IPV2_9HYPH|nr:UDP-N-acetylmuramate dehydrogenase [Pelagibacterium sp. YIM 151497]UYQ72633.1 UDP-N-acetylmuramate dehydrogenase [Pelagibacterium sp. YIM 151497]